MLVMNAIRAGYGARIVLDEIDLTIAQGEHISLIGHNGAGKSTILKAITGQIRPVSGTITYRGKRIDRMLPETLVTLGIVQVPAGRRVFPQLTVKQNLEAGAFSRRDHKGIAEDLDRMFDRFKTLALRRGAKAGVLSGGEQQMLAIARGLMARPTMLLVDEPSLGLSPIMVDQVFDFLSSLADDKVSLVLAEQNVRKALSVTDRTIVLSQGAIASEMSSAELLTNEDFRKTYLGAGHAA